MTPPDWTKLAVRKSREHTWTLGYLFDLAHRLENLSPEDIATELGCSLEVLDQLALCRRPDKERFAEHLGIIAERLGVAPLALARFIRRMDNLEKDAHPSAPAGDMPLGTLLAARDRSEEDDEDDEDDP